MRKAQMEIMGLAIVIVLIMLGVLFVVQFMIQKPQKDIKASYTDAQLAANMLNAILKATARDCNNQVITTLFQDCASGPTIICNDGINTSCTYLNYTIKDLFDKTLVKWRKKHRFTASKTPVVVGWGDCSGERESKSSPIQTDVGTIIIRLDICGESPVTPSGVRFISNLTVCKNYEALGTCANLDIDYFSGYRAACCNEHNVCC